MAKSRARLIYFLLFGGFTITYNTTGGLTNMSPPHLTLQKAPWHVSHEDYTCHKELRPGGAHGHVGLPPAGSGFATAL